MWDFYIENETEESDDPDYYYHGNYVDERGVPWFQLSSEKQYVDSNRMVTV